MSKETLRNLIELVPEEDIDTLCKVVIKFVPEGKTLPLDDDIIESRLEAFKGLMSFAGTLPEDFNYKKELEEMREEKYARFV